MVASDGGECKDFSAAKCYKDEFRLDGGKNDQIVPIDDRPLAEEFCQGVCKTYADCYFFTFIKETNMCELYTASYRQTCEKYGGTKVCTRCILKISAV